MWISLQPWSVLHNTFTQSPTLEQYPPTHNTHTETRPFPNSNILLYSYISAVDATSNINIFNLLPKPTILQCGTEPLADLVPPLSPPFHSSQAGIEVPGSLPPSICFTYCTSNLISYPTPQQICKAAARCQWCQGFAALLFSLVGCQRASEQL